jgi:predicted small lipoprotein YifL
VTGTQRRVRLHGVLAAACLMLVGCGQKGPLMLPGETDARPGVPAPAGPAAGDEAVGEPQGDEADEDEERRGEGRDSR